MIFTLRPYQQEAVDATLNHFRRHKTPAVIVLPTGAGKSLVIAELARLARGRVLVLAHVKELVAQNHEKYQALGLEADIFAAGLKRKESHGKVVFGSVQSVTRNLDAFQGEFSLLIVDECHRIGDDEESQYQQILTHLTKVNPHLRLLGLTATPFRLGKGWIYQFHYHGMVRGDEKALFRDCIYELPLRYMIKHGYLTPPERLDMPVVQYDFSRLQAQSNGLFSEADLNRELKKQQRITPHIISQIMEFAATRKGVMIFAATVEHAKEIVGLLPAEDAALITGDTPGSERDVLIDDFKAQRFRYLVNVAVLTTGFDAPHVDLIAILRPTESVSLYQQIVGRGLRLAPGKTDCLILDYAGNPHDLYAPEVGTPKGKSDNVPVQVFCPACGFANTFWGKTTADGTLIEHFGRRCQGWFEDDDGHREQCDFRFRFKNCPQCNAENAALQYELPVLVVNLNNRYLGMVKQWQDMIYSGRHSQSYMQSLPDFVRLAEAYGHVGIQISHPQELESKLSEALEQVRNNRLVFVDVTVDGSEHVYPMQIRGGGMDEMWLSKTERT